MPPVGYYAPDLATKSQGNAKESAAHMKLAFGPFLFDAETRELLESGVRVHLSPKAFDLLQFLLERAPAVAAKAEILDRIWPDTHVGDASLSVVVAEIRHGLRDDPRQPRFIRTVHRVGYAFSGVARLVDDTPSPRQQQPGPVSCWLVRDGRPVTLAPGENVIGRDPRCAVWIEASGVSRRHARIDVDAEGARIVDLQSSNGTFVGGQPVTAPRLLADGDVIELGTARLVYRRWSDAVSAPTERVARTPVEPA